MFCNKCGKEIDQDAKFCIHCGETVEQESASSAEAVAESVENSVGVTEELSAVSLSETVEEAPSAEAEPVSEEAAPAPQKKKFRLTLRGLICAVVILCVLGLAVWAAYPSVKRTVMGEAAYYVAEELSAFDDLLDNVLVPYDGSVDSTLTLDVEGGAEMDTDAIAGINIINDLLDEFSFNYYFANDTKAQKLQIVYGVQEDKKEMLAASALFAGQDITVALPSLTEKTATLRLSADIASLLWGEEDQIKEITGVSASKLEKKIRSYVKDCLIGALKEAKTEKGKETLGTDKFETVTFEITEDVIEAFLDKLATKLEKDKELIDIIENICSYIEQKSEQGYDGLVEEWPAILQPYLDEMPDGKFTFEKPDREDIKEAISEIVEALRDAKDEVDLDVDISYIVYYGSRNTVAGRELKMKAQGMTVRLYAYSYTENGEHIDEIGFRAGEQKVILRNVYTESWGKYEGKLSLKMDMNGTEESGALKYSFKMEKIEGRDLPCGTFSLDIPELEEMGLTTYSLTTEKTEKDTWTVRCVCEVEADGQSVKAEATVVSVFNKKAVFRDMPNGGDISENDFEDIVEEFQEILEDSSLGEYIFNTSKPEADEWY